MRGGLCVRGGRGAGRVPRGLLLRLCRGQRDAVPRGDVVRRRRCNVGRDVRQRVPARRVVRGGRGGADAVPRRHVVRGGRRDERGDVRGVRGGGAGGGVRGGRDERDAGGVRERVLLCRRRGGADGVQSGDGVLGGGARGAAGVLLAGDDAGGERRDWMGGWFGYKRGVPRPITYRTQRK